MKKEWEITDKYLALDLKLKKKEDQYFNLDEVDIVSGEGIRLTVDINKIKGEIKAFKWILDIK